MDVLQKRTVFVHQEDNEIRKKPRNHGFLKSTVSGKGATTTLPKHDSYIAAKLPSRSRDTVKYPKEKLKLDEVKAVPGSVKRTHYGDTTYRVIKTTSEFLFAAADKTGQKISSKKPSFFELGGGSDFQKIL